MTILRALILGVAGLVSVSVLLADTITDPRGTIIYHCCSPGVGTEFTFTVDEQGGGFFDFHNASDVPWISVALTLPAPTSELSQYNCALGPGQQNAFENCSFSLFSDPSSPTGMDITLLYSGVVPPDDGAPPPPPPGGCKLHPRAVGCEIEDAPEGISPGQGFAIDLNDLSTDPTGGWIPGSTVVARANVPEPGTVLMVLPIVGALLASQTLRRRFRQRG